MKNEICATAKGKGGTLLTVFVSQVPVCSLPEKLNLAFRKCLNHQARGGSKVGQSFLLMLLPYMEYLNIY